MDWLLDTLLAEELTLEVLIDEVLIDDTELLTLEVLIEDAELAELTDELALDVLTLLGDDEDEDDKSSID